MFTGFPWDLLSQNNSFNLHVSILVIGTHKRFTNGNKKENTEIKKNNKI